MSVFTTIPIPLRQRIDLPESLDDSGGAFTNVQEALLVPPLPQTLSLGETWEVDSVSGVFTAQPANGVNAGVITDLVAWIEVNRIPIAQIHPTCSSRPNGYASIWRGATSLSQPARIETTDQLAVRVSAVIDPTVPVSFGDGQPPHVTTWTKTKDNAGGIAASLTVHDATHPIHVLDSFAARMFFNAAGGAANELQVLLNSNQGTFTNFPLGSLVTTGTPFDSDEVSASGLNLAGKPGEDLTVSFNAGITNLIEVLLIQGHDIPAFELWMLGKDDVFPFSEGCYITLFGTDHRP